MIRQITTLQDYVSALKLENDAMDKQWKISYNNLVKRYGYNDFVKYNLAYKVNKQREIVLYLCMGKKKGKWIFSELFDFGLERLIDLDSSGKTLASLISREAIIMGIKHNKFHSKNVVPLNISFSETVEELAKTDKTIESILAEYSS